MTVPLDLDAIRKGADGYLAYCCTSAWKERTIHQLCAEVERLRAENERHQKAHLVRAVMKGYAGDEWVNEVINAENFDRVPWLVADKLVKKNEALQADAVPRSTLVQVGWQVKRGVRVILELGRPFALEECTPVYVLREDADE